MLQHYSWLLLVAALNTQAAVIQSQKTPQPWQSETTCACTHTVTQRVPAELKGRQEPCPAPVTSTETTVLTQTVTLPLQIVTVIPDDSNSVSSYFSSVGAIDSAVIVHSSQDRPTGQPADTAPNYFTRTASGPAYVASDDPNDSTIEYRVISTTEVPVSTTTESFPPAGPVIPPTSAVDKSPDATPSYDSTVTTTVDTYASTVTVAVPATITASSNGSVASRLQKRQTCSMIFAKINGEWASWCNNWDGTSTLTYTTYNTTVLVTHPVGLESPIPESVYNPALSLPVSISMVATEHAPASTSKPETLPAAPVGPISTSVPATLPGVHPSPVKPSSTSVPQTLPGAPYSNTTMTSSAGKPNVTSLILTTSIVRTFPVTTITTVLPDGAAPSPSLSCGETGDFTIGFDNLPRYSNSNPNDTASPPIFDPYSHMYWTSGYGYGPPPNVPYMPQDSDRLALYDPLDAVEAPTDKTEGRFLPGSFGAGPRFNNKVFWFDAKSVYIGCNNRISSKTCEVTVTGYHWAPTPFDNTTAVHDDDPGYEVFAYTQPYNVPAICADQPCPLTQVFFDPSRFVDLTSLNIVAKVDDTEVAFYLDSFDGAWSDNSCEAGLTRSSARK